MKARLRASFLAALAAGVVFAGAASAQSPTVRPLDRQVAHEMFTAFDMADLLKTAASHATGFDQFEKARPGWKALMIESVDEVVVKDQQALEDVLARSLSKTMKEDELTAALTVFSDPQARLMIAASARHETLPSGGTPCSQACVRAMSSPAGRAFLTKINGVVGPSAEQDFVAALVPDLFITFGEKAKAAEAKRAAP